MSQPSADNLLKPLEFAIRQKVIPALTGQPAPNDTVRKLLALPARLGGLGILDPTSAGTTQREMSEEISAPLVDTILQNSTYSLNDRQVEEGIIQVEGKQKATRRRLNLKS